MKEAIFYEKLKDKKVKCTACNRYCIIPKNSAGFCRVRKNLEGKLFLLVYNKTLTLTVDPIEKKPFYHFKPGSVCNSISTFGCNFACKHCQNYSISQEFLESQIEGTEETTSKEIIEDTRAKAVGGISYTYTEPTIFAEYALDTMKLAKKAGLYNVWVSNGYTSKEVFKKIIPYLDAINIDLKGNKDFYLKVCGGIDIEKVKENIEKFSQKTHVEVTNLIIPGFNDSERDLNDICKFIASINSEIPLHFSRFFPYYKMNAVSATPIETLQKAKEIAKKNGLKYVYVGNTQEESNTYCPKCNNLLIERKGYSTFQLGLKQKQNKVLCKKCENRVPIIL
ncbi:MAG: AmmeMemoRadiSam system radical SAM enzyme [Candidatus Diapherotrites archaeon CG08_land_8_20_14_0_20_34_12]|nr:MAG: AmmeMemoRadiSam system radical SAM enzyme [Candidatus Diapherotrites archaeon CG08_land_8_20_14_0_20_34_12]